MMIRTLRRRGSPSPDGLSSPGHMVALARQASKKRTALSLCSPDVVPVRTFPTWRSRRGCRGLEGISFRGQKKGLVDQLVRADQHPLRHVEAERLGGLQVDYELELRGLLDRQRRRVRPFQYLGNDAAH